MYELAWGCFFFGQVLNKLLKFASGFFIRNPDPLTTYRFLIMWHINGFCNSHSSLDTLPEKINNLKIRIDILEWFSLLKFWLQLAYWKQHHQAQHWAKTQVLVVIFSLFSSLKKESTTQSYNVAYGSSVWLFSNLKKILLKLWLQLAYCKQFEATSSSIALS